MVKSKRYLPCLALFCGFLGVVVCLAGMVGVWSIGSRLNRTNEKVFDGIDKTLVVVRERVTDAQHQVQDSRITIDDIGQSLKNWTQKETRERLTSRIEVEEKAEQLVLGLRQADQWLEVSGESIYRVQQALELGSSLGAPMDAALVDPLLEAIGARRSQLETSTEMIDGIRERAAEVTAGESREERIDQAVQLTLRVVATLTELDSRLGESADRLLEVQSKAQRQHSKTHRQIVVAKIGVLLLIAWMGVGQTFLFLYGWKSFRRS